MITRLMRVTILVRDYDEALAFYTGTLGFEKRDDIPFGPGARWVTVAPPEQHEVEIVLQQPHAAFHGETQAQAMLEHVGQQPTWVFETDDCQREYEKLQGRGVVFTSLPKQEPYGVEAVFQDLYGNNYSLLQPAPAPDQG
ncbi:MAG: VOC family protein [Ktedonobacterales bacterium]